jgi:hypothetical protein
MSGIGKPDYGGIETIGSNLPDPFFTGYCSLPKDAYQQIRAYLIAVRIWQGENNRAFHHVRVFSTLEGTVKPEAPEALH